MSDQSSVPPSQNDEMNEEEKVADLIRSASLLPPALREALLKRIEEGLSEDETQSVADHRSFSRLLNSVNPSGVLGQVAKRVEDYRSERLEQLRGGVRRVTDKIDVRGEMQRLLSQISIEVRLKIRLIPSKENQIGLKPHVESSAHLNLHDPHEHATVQDNETTPDQE